MLVQPTRYKHSYWAALQLSMEVISFMSFKDSVLLLSNYSLIFTITLMVSFSDFYFTYPFTKSSLTEIEIKL